ncbi:predicted protein, partial [Nematostella vectensis]
MALQSDQSIEMNQIVQPLHTNQKDNKLSGGQLLKWMDATACLAAEKHAGNACVTASMDDLHFDQDITIGQVVNLRAKVNRAFNTSMEVGVVVSVEDLITGEKREVSRGFFTFVAFDAKHNKVQLSPIDPVTEEERLQYALASERRRMRIRHGTDLKEMTEKQLSNNASPAKVQSGVKVRETLIQSVELVLPPHANHHQSTFGGQILAWMVTLCSIAATRLGRTHAQLRSVDEVKFRGPSRVGDRVVIRAIVNNTFENSMEVGCRVEAYAVGGETRHINSAFFTFVAPDSNGSAKTLPVAIPETEDEKRRAAEAVARREIRAQRRAIRQSIGPVISIPWSPTNSQMLNYNNIEALTRLYEHTGWELVNSVQGVTLYKREISGFLCVKSEFVVDCPACKVYDLMCNEEHRKEWDPFFADSKIIEVVDQDDDIYYFFLENPSGAATSSDDPPKSSSRKPNDMVVLVSRRAPSDSKDHYIIAYRSVTHSAAPPVPEHNRVENLCSGWLIKGVPGEPNCTTLTYINQMTRELTEYV